ncbi:MAG TPA: ATP-binding protein [Polyangia bacterium]|nr:ATP-binding protein [Polyangia bacterium]
MPNHRQRGKNLTQSERIFLAQLRSLWPVLDPLPTSVLAVSWRRRVLFANRAARRLLSGEPERRLLEDAFAAGDVTLAPAGPVGAADLGVDRALAGQPVEAEEVRFSVRGVVTFLRVTTAPIQGPDKRAVGVLVLLTDVTELVAGERRASLLAHLGRALVARLDPAAIAAQVAELTGRGLGAPCALFLATPTGELEAPGQGATIPPLRTAAERALARRQTLWSGETLAAPILREGQALGAIALGSPAQPPDGPLVEQVAGLTALALEGARLRAETQAASDAKDAVLAVASHEISTPLSALAGYADILAHVMEQPVLNRTALERAAHGIQRTAEQVQALSQRLLDSERIRRGQLLVERRPGDLLPVVRETIERAGIGYGRPIDLEINVSALPGRWDPVRVEQALDNLLSNAIHYSRPDSPVRVRVERRGSEARIAIEDRGIGIPEADRPHVFEAFRRGSNAAAAGPGLGLGLHLVHEIVRAHEGRVWFDSVVGRGTTFWLVLPLE